MHNQVKLRVDKRNKSHALAFYDHTEGGVNVVDLIFAKMSTRMKTRRWTLNVFALMLDTARTNAKASDKATQYLPVHLGTRKIARKKLHSATP